MFSHPFKGTPVLVATTEIKTGDVAYKVSISGLANDRATFVVESPDKVQNVHWIAVGDLI
jgi:hypothetical protein